MDRVQKRCFIGSLGLHGFLLLIFLFGSAFFPARKPDIDTTPTIKILQLPDVLTDGKTGGGGNPLQPVTNEQKKGDPNAAIKPTPPAPQPPVQKTQVKPPEPKVTPKAVEVVKPDSPKM